MIRDGVLVGDGVLVNLCKNGGFFLKEFEKKFGGENSILGFETSVFRIVGGILLGSETKVRKL